MPTLTRTEATALKRLERTVEDGLTRFAQAGEALQQIRDERLWRGVSSSFATYCRERWSITESRASQLIRGAVVAAEVPGLTSMRAATELAKHDAPTRKRIADSVESSGKVTTTDVRRAAKRVANTAVVKDGLGERVEDDDFAATLDEAKVLESLKTDLLLLKRRLLATEDWNHYTAEASQDITSHFKALANAIRWSKPFTLCPYCGGKGCKACKKSGWVNKESYHASPSELR